MVDMRELPRRCPPEARGGHERFRFEAVETTMRSTQVSRRLSTEAATESWALEPEMVTIQTEKGWYPRRLATVYSPSTSASVRKEALASAERRLGTTTRKIT